MSLLDSIKLSVKNIRRKKTKTFLSVLGIVIGVASVILIMCVGGGGQQAVLNEIDRFGINAVTVKATAANTKGLTIEDCEYLQSVIKNAEFIPVYMNYASIQTRNGTRDAVVWGVGDGYESIFPLTISQGRNLLQGDFKTKKTMALIGQSVADTLTGTGKQIGKTIEIIAQTGRTTATVCGIMDEENSVLSDALGSAIPAFLYMPIEKAQSLFHSDKIDYISINCENEEKMNAAGVRAVRALERKYGGEDLFYAENLSKQKELLMTILNIITLIISAIAAISLIVGGLGIMNIMLVSVGERQQEIGMMKAIGAKKQDILLQFLTEAVVITGLGAVLGTIAGLGLGAFLTSILKFPLTVQPGIILAVLFFVTGIGLIFGVYPAKKAAALDPVEALR